MAQSSAERQRAFRQRQKKLLAADAAPAPTPNEMSQRRKAMRVSNEALAHADIFSASAEPDRIFALPLHPPKVVPQDKALRMAMDDFGGTAWAASQIGQSLDGGVAFFGYPMLSELAQRPEYRVISETIASEMTRKWIKVKASGDEGGKADEVNAIEAEIKRLKLRDHFRTLVEHDGYFGRSHLYLEFTNPDQPIPPSDDELKTSVGNGVNAVSKSKVGPSNTLARVKVIEAVWCYPVDYNTTDPMRADWYRPGAWFSMGKQVHASRLLTFIGREVPDLLKPSYSFGGLSMSQMAKPYVDNWLRTRSSVADLIYSFSVMVLKTNMGETLETEGGDNLFKRVSLFNKMRANSGTMVIDKDDEELDNVAAPLGTLDSLQAQTQEHMACLKGDTLIETMRGQIAIKDVTTSDMVMTRNGYAPVAWAGVTKYASQMVRIETEGSVVLCTEEHPIWIESENRFVLAESVNLSHRLRKSPAWENTACLSRGGATYGAPRKQAISATLKQGGCSIASITRRILAQSQMALMSITAAAIRSICPGLKFSHAGSITPSMNQEDFCAELIRNSNFSASSAGVTTPPHGLTALYTALEHVNREHGEKETRIIDVRVVNCEVQPVYDITVADGHLPEFYANGVLVHNSVSRIPLVKLTGISPSGLNASSDGEIRVFYDFINAYQELMFRDHLTAILGFIQLSLFGQIDPEITFDFEPLYSLDEKGKAELRQIDASTDAAMIDKRIISRVEARKRIADDPDTLYPSLDTDAIPVLEDEQKASYAAAAAGAIGGMVQAQVIDQATALKELVAVANVAGIFSQITQEDIANAEMAPPPGSMMGMPGQPGMPPGVPGPGGPPGHSSDPSPQDDPSAQPPAGAPMPPKQPAMGGAPPPPKGFGQDEFIASQHPRGQPNNAGEFGPGGGGKSNSPTPKRDTLDLSSPKSPVKRDIMDISTKVAQIKGAAAPSAEKTKRVWEMVHAATENDGLKKALAKSALFTEKTSVKVAHRAVANAWVDKIAEGACVAALLYLGIESPIVEGIAVAVGGWMIDHIIDKIVGEDKAADVSTDILKYMLDTFMHYPAVPKINPNDAIGVAADEAPFCLGLLRLIHAIETTPIDTLRDAGKGFDLDQLLEGNGPDVAQDEFVESKHPRGQPGNAGEFGPGGGGKKPAKASSPDPEDDVPGVAPSPDLVAKAAKIRAAKAEKAAAPKPAKGFDPSVLPNPGEWKNKDAPVGMPEGTVWSRADWQRSKDFLAPAFHGTTSDVVASILKDGITPGHPGGADDWLRAKGGSVQKFARNADDPEAAEKERACSTYISTNPDLAASMANMVVTMHKGATPVVLGVQIPASELSRVVHDEGFRGEPAYRFKGAIKPEWIHVIEVPKKKKFPGRGKMHVTVDADGGEQDLILYLVPITGTPKEGDDDDPGVAQDEFVESQHPRGQPTNAGEFAKGGGSAGVSPKQQPSGGVSPLGGGNTASHGVMFVSPNVKDGVTFKDARSEVTSKPSARLVALHKASDDVDKAMGIKGQSRSAIGAWSDGAEASVMTEVDGASFDQLRAAAAMKGYLADQKAVLVFKAKATGTSVLFHFRAQGDISAIHNALLEDGVAFHTLAPFKGGADVYVADLDGSALESVEKAAKRYGSEIDATHGDAEFIGTQKEDGTDREQRDDARRAYESVIGSARHKGAGSIWEGIHSAYGDALDLGDKLYSDPQYTGKSNGVPLDDPAAVEAHIRATATRLGFDGAKVHFAGLPVKQDANGIEGSTLGVALEHDANYNGVDYHAGDILLFGDQGTGIPSDGVIAHEIMHKKFGTAMSAATEEAAQITPDMVDEEGELISDADRKRFPAYAEISPFFAWGFSGLHKGNHVPKSFADLIESDGITRYSYAYWDKFGEPDAHMSVWLPINETLAEIAKIDNDDSYSQAKRDAVKPIWRKAFAAVNKVYADQKTKGLAQDDAQNFNPNEPRKADGEWTEGGGSSGKLLDDLTVNSILHPDFPSQKSRSRNVEDIAAELDTRGSKALKDLGVRSGRIEGPDPKTDPIISRAIASEISSALKRPGASASGWYSAKVKEAVATAAQLHPEIATDANAKMAFFVCLAVTSQGEAVPSNVRLADKAYREFKATGKFPENVKAKKDPSMNANFAKMNAMIAKGGLDATREFLNKEFTVKQLMTMGYKAPGEKVDTVVRGSAILGAKIGGGFYQNLNGNFDPVTMDLWFMRAWGRLTGTLVGMSPEAVAKQRTRLEKALAADGQKVPKTGPGLEKIAKGIVARHEVDFDKNRGLYDSGDKNKSEVTLAAERFLIGQTGVNEQPSSAGQRDWMRSVVQGARKILKEDKGIDITPADLQAVWWYPEKTLYDKLGGRDSEAINTSYAEAFADMLKESKEAVHD